MEKYQGKHLSCNCNCKFALFHQIIWPLILPRCAGVAGGITATVYAVKNIISDNFTPPCYIQEPGSGCHQSHPPQLHPGAGLRLLLAPSPLLHSGAWLRLPLAPATFRSQSPAATSTPAPATFRPLRLLAIHPVVLTKYMLVIKLCHQLIYCTGIQVST